MKKSGIPYNKKVQENGLENLETVLSLAYIPVKKTHVCSLIDFKCLDPTCLKRDGFNLIFRANETLTFCAILLT